MDRVEATGRTVNEAVDNALMRLGVERDQVEVEVLSEGSRGILGIGAEDARVVVSVRDAAVASATTGRAAATTRPPSGLEAVPRQPLRALEDDLPEVGPAEGPEGDE